MKRGMKLRTISIFASRLGCIFMSIFDSNRASPHRIHFKISRSNYFHFFISNLRANPAVSKASNHDFFMRLLYVWCLQSVLVSLYSGRSDVVREGGREKSILTAIFQMKAKHIFRWDFLSFQLTVMIVIKMREHRAFHRKCFSFHYLFIELYLRFILFLSDLMLSSDFILFFSAPLFSMKIGKLSLR